MYTELALIIVFIWSGDKSMVEPLVEKESSPGRSGKSTQCTLDPKNVFIKVPQSFWHHLKKILHISITNTWIGYL